MIVVAAIATAALVGGTLNLVSAALSGKIKNVGDALAYFGAGAAGGVVALYNPVAGFAVTAGLNVAVDFATGNAYNTRGDASSGVNFLTLGFSVLDGFNAVSGGQVGNFVFQKLLEKSTKAALIITARSITNTATQELTKQTVSTGVKVGAKETAEITGKQIGEKIAKEGLEESAKLGSNKLHSVYELVDKTRNVKYVGRTIQELSVREAQHYAKDIAKRGLKIIYAEGGQNLTLRQAKFLEQTLILRYGGPKGGQLLNKINSIAPKKWINYGIKSIWP